MIEGAVETLDYLRRMGIKVGIVTNNSGVTAPGVQRNLAKAGIHFEPGEITSALTATALWIKSQGVHKTAYALGTPGVALELQRHGIDVISDPHQCGYKCDFLVVGGCTEINRDVLTPALRVGLAGAHFVAINMDRTYPGEDGSLYPGAGATVGAVSGVLGRQPDTLIGKPAPLLGLAALETLGVSAAESLFVGDTLGIDVKFGKAVGMDTALVLTGNSKADEVTSQNAPTFVMNSVVELVPASLRVSA